jgi:hypothetical protein
MSERVVNGRTLHNTSVLIGIAMFAVAVAPTSNSR